MKKLLLLALALAVPLCATPVFAAADTRGDRRWVERTGGQSLDQVGEEKKKRTSPMAEGV
jgi:hypothetical protein